MTKPLCWQIGQVKVTRIVEMDLPLKAGEPDTFLPLATLNLGGKFVFPDFYNATY